jgi:copper chaperone
MTSFRVDNMTCGHCTAVITEALQAIDPSARIRVNLGAHQVDIDSPTADVFRLHSAIANAGYPAVLLEGVVATADRPAKVKSACCCG